MLTTQPLNDYNPVISPRMGRKISFVFEGDPGIFQNGEVSLVVSSASKFASPSCGEDNEKLLYVSYERGVNQLWLANLNDNTSFILTGDEDVFPFRAVWFGLERIHFFYWENTEKENW